MMTQPEPHVPAGAPQARPIVFLGPSLPHREAAKILDADFRPPIQRGDLNGIAPGSVVAIVDGVFGDTLAISPSEIRGAVLHGIRVFGSSSMGALRAAEVREMVGVGRIYAMLDQEVIDSDDEVALVFDQETLRPLSEPLINIRHAVERLRNPGTIDAALASRIIECAERLFYPERTYRRILEEIGIVDRTVANQLAGMLRSYDLKREDAITLLEQLSREKRGVVRPDLPVFAFQNHAYDTMDEVEAARTVAPDAPVFLWEYGESIPFRDLVRFLKLTGEFEACARSAVARHMLHGNAIEVEGDAEEWDPTSHVEAEVSWLRYQWGWWAAEESRVTLRDFGLGFEDLLGRIEEEVTARRRLRALAREESDDFLRALRAELFLSSSLALKRHAIRYGSLLRLADKARESGPPSEDEISAAKLKIAECVDARDWRVVLAMLADWGVDAATCEEFAILLALARRTGGELLREMFGASPRTGGRRSNGHDPRKGKPRKGDPFVEIARSPKVPGDRRFCMPLAEALRHTARFRKVIGVTRLANVTGLCAVGIPNAQAYRPDGRFSTTIGSGKSLSLDGAKVGAVMEEVEKWAQEQYDDTAQPELIDSFEALSARNDVLDPRLLDLPHDSAYHPRLPIAWRRCHDLASDELLYVPLAALTATRLPDDIFYSPRLALKLFSSNGLASGFTVAEALTHALSEAIERHATKLAELRIDNPGGFDTDAPFRFVDLATLPASCTEIVQKIHASGARVQLLHITSEVKVSTFWAMIYTEREGTLLRFGLRYRRASGYGTHPDPEVAANKALLEACQTQIVNITGGREDLALKSRSLGRHERTRAHSRAGLAKLLGSSADSPHVPFSEIPAYCASDAREEVRFIVERLRAAGVRHVFALSFGPAAIAPARVVRVVLPGLETINPFSTGLRPRVSLLRDLLPAP